MCSSWSSAISSTGPLPLPLSECILHVHKITTEFRLTVSHAAQWSEQVFSPFVVTNQAGVAKVQLSDGESIFLGDVSVIKHVDACQASITVTRVPASLISIACLTLRLQATRTLARVRCRSAPVSLDHVRPPNPPSPAWHVQIGACCTHGAMSTSSNIRCR